MTTFEPPKTLRGIRESAHKSIREAERQLGVPRSSLSNYERGLRELPSGLARLMAEFYGSTVEEVVKAAGMDRLRAERDWLRREAAEEAEAQPEAPRRRRKVADQP